MWSIKHTSKCQEQWQQLTMEASILIVVWPGFREPQMAVRAALQGRGLPAI